ncbi:hypothetical protein GCM10023097_29930 [Streptomyces collinus]
MHLVAYQRFRRETRLTRGGSRRSLPTEACRGRGSPAGPTGGRLATGDGSLSEVLRLRDHADLPAMGRDERQYGALAEGPMDGWKGRPQAAEPSAEEFDLLWTEARRTLGRSA